MSTGINKNGITYFLNLRRAAPELLKLIERAEDIMIELESLADRAFTSDASKQKSQWHKDVATLIAKIEEGEK